MSRYADVDAYKAAWVDFAEKCTITKYRINMFSAPPSIDDIPSVDIVRCGECEKYDSHDHRCKYFNHGIADTTAFCSWGRRRDNETDRCGQID